MKTLVTGFGLWNPIVWIIAYIIIYIGIKFLEDQGHPDTTKKGDMVLPFTSGNYVEEENARIKASNVYWGFVEAMKGYYNTLSKIHTGIVSDYVYWYIGILAVIIILIGVGR